VREERQRPADRKDLCDLASLRGLPQKSLRKIPAISELRVRGGGGWVNQWVCFTVCRCEQDMLYYTQLGMIALFILRINVGVAQDGDAIVKEEGPVTHVAR